MHDQVTAATIAGAGGAEVRALFTPTRLGELELRNRVVMAPMTRARAGAVRIPNEMMKEYYASRASAGLIITEGVQISEQGIGFPGTPGIHTEAQVEAWRPITRAVHSRGGAIFLQLWHVGRVSHPSWQLGGQLPVAPSAVAFAGSAFTEAGPVPAVTPHELQSDEIRSIVKDFARGAHNAVRAGFDGVEIHGANGYLIDQFIRDNSNRRSDAWGGSIERRVRFLLEVTDAVAAEAGAAHVGVRLSPLIRLNDVYDSTPLKTFIYAAAELGRRGLAYLHVVEAPEAGSQHPRDPHFNFGAIRRAFGRTYIAAAGYSIETGAQAVESASADLVAFGRTYLCNPDLVERGMQGATVFPPPPREYWYGGGALGYTDLDEFRRPS